MAHDKEIRFKCRALFEISNMTLSEIGKQESVGISTLSDWKNDDREEYGGIWVQGCKSDGVQKTAKKLMEELETTSVYDELKKNLHKYHGINDKGAMEIGGMLDLSTENKELQAKAELEVTLLGAVGADWFDSQLLKNSMLSSIVLNNQVKKDITKVKQSDIKASSEIHKIAKESRFGKSPDTVIINSNGDYTPEELDGMSIEQLEALARKNVNDTVEANVVESESVDSKKV